MRTTIFLSTLVLCLNIANAQKISKYNGPFDVSNMGQNGTANYSYYENEETYQRIKNGLFTFSFNGKNIYKGLVEKIEGKYKNNLKEGQWTYTITFTDYKSGRYYLTGKNKLIANYKDGKPNGIWTSLEQGKTRTLEYNVNTRKYEFSGWRSPNSSKTTANFRNGTLVGQFNHNEKDEHSNTQKSIISNFSEQGFFNDKTIFSEIGEETIYEYSDGFLVRKINKNTQKGSASIQNHRDDFAVVESLRTMKKDEPQNLANQEYKIVEGYSKSKVIENLIREYFFNEMFHYTDIDGDVNFTKDELYQFNGLKRIWLEQQTSQDNVQQIAEIKKKISQIKKTNDSIYRVHSKDIESRELKKQIRELCAITSTISYYTDRMESFYQGRCYRGYEGIQAELEFFKNTAKSDALNKIESTLDKRLENLNKTKFKLKNRGKQLAIDNEKLKKKRRFNAMFNSIRSNIKIKEDKIYKSYHKINKIPGSTSGETVSRLKHKHIWAAYTLLAKYYSEKINLEKDIVNKILILGKYSKLCDKILALPNLNTKIISKQVKKTDNPEELIKILDFLKPQLLNF